jgi:hypothetical protein
LRDESRYRVASAAARERAKKFDIESVVPLYEAVYQRVVDG